MNSVTSKKKVLFLYTENSACSVMAEALLRHKANDYFAVYSAGTSSQQIDSRVYSALNKFGINSESLRSTHINEFSGVEFDYVIFLCNKASQEYRDYSAAKKQLSWDFLAPKLRVDNNPFITVLNELDSRLSMFINLELDTGELKLESMTELPDHNMLSLEPVSFYKCLTDNIRLKALLLTNYFGELCVCELMMALEENSQPKVSRNLALLKKAQIITDRKHGQWVFYQINPNLPLWAKSIISQTSEQNLDFIRPHIERLNKMENRPDKSSFCK